MENLFSGWTDVDLSERGIAEARQAGKQLISDGFAFDVAFTSVLKRAIRTLWIVLDEMDLMWIPIESCWRLNERHYGALQGENKANMAKKYGTEQVQIWRRSYNVRSPDLSPDDPRHPRFDRRYAGLSQKELPAAESLEDTLRRVLPYWNQTIVPYLQKNARVLIVAHGNSLRALIKHLDGISDSEIVSLNIPTGIPLVYELGKNLEVIDHYYLGDAEAAKAAAAAVARQAEAGKSTA
jgi:2,3-bisphosphoglycerate-dependent phosphoglycerate mutase